MRLTSMHPTTVVKYNCKHQSTQTEESGSDTVLQTSPQDMRDPSAKVNDTKVSELTRESEFVWTKYTVCSLWSFQDEFAGRNEEEDIAQKSTENRTEVSELTRDSEFVWEPEVCPVLSLQDALNRRDASARVDDKVTVETTTAAKQNQAEVSELARETKLVWESDEVCSLWSVQDETAGGNEEEDIAQKSTENPVEVSELPRESEVIRESELCSSFSSQDDLAGGNGKEDIAQKSTENGTEVSEVSRASEFIRESEDCSSLSLPDDFSVENEEEDIAQKSPLMAKNNFGSLSSQEDFPVEVETTGGTGLGDSANPLKAQEGKNRHLVQAVKIFRHSSKRKARKSSKSNQKSSGGDENNAGQKALKSDDNSSSNNSSSNNSNSNNSHNNRRSNHNSSNINDTSVWSRKRKFWFEFIRECWQCGLRHNKGECVYPKNVTCTYPHCEIDQQKMQRDRLVPYSHHYSACPLLHSRCPNCFCRGHFKQGCHISYGLDEDMRERNEAVYSVYRTEGVYARNKRDSHWNFTKDPVDRN